MRANTLTDRAAIERTGAIVGSHKTGRTEIKTGLACLILASSASAAAQRGLELSQAYEMFCDVGFTIKTGDKVTDQNGRVFDVSGVRVQPGIFTKHQQVLINLKV